MTGTYLVDRVLGLLKRVKPSGTGFVALCPAHEDHNPSLRITRGDDGRVLLKCFAGCTFKEICTAIGLDENDMFAGTPSAGRKSRESTKKHFATLAEATGGATKVWTYPDLTGVPVFWMARYDGQAGKTFRPFHQADDGVVCGDPPGPLPLYLLPELQGAETVYLCEGEKAADAAVSIGLVATTSAHGAKCAKVDKHDWSILAGKEIVILPDNDEAGRDYATDVATIVTTLNPPASVRILDLPDLPPKGDIVDWIERHDSRDDSDLCQMLDALASDTPPYEPAPAPEAPKRLEWRPFPVALIPEPVSTYIQQASAAIGCDPAYVAPHVLASVAAAIGTTRTICLKRSWHEPAVFWVATVGRSGSLKSPAHAVALEPLRRWEAEMVSAFAEARKTYRLERTRYEVALKVTLQPRAMD